MANLLPLHMNAPGAAGVNFQDGDGVLDPAWATKANNLILNKKGRLQTRPGTMMVGAGTQPNSIKRLYSHRHSNGVLYQYLQQGSSQLYELIGGTWTAYPTLKDGGANTCFADAIKFQTFNSKLIMVGRDPNNLYHIAHRQVTPTIAPVFIPALPFGAQECLAAFGRVWVVDKTSLYWSNLLDETTWTPADTINLTNVWPNGADEPIGLQEYNGFLVIFGRRSIVVYEKPDQVAAGNMVKVEAIDGVGLLSRDLVQSTGDDLIFMSPGGLVSLSRVIQEKSMPIQRAGDHIRDAVLGQFNSNSFFAENASSAYDKTTGNFFMKVMAQESKTYGDGAVIYCANVKVRHPDGSLPFTTFNWSTTATDFYFDSDCHLALYEDGDPENSGIWATAWVGSQSSWVPVVVTEQLSVDAATDLNGTAGVPIEIIEWESGWLDFSQFELEDFEKILKKARIAVEGAGGYDVVLKYWIDYDDDTTYTETVTAPSNNNVEQLFYNIGQRGQVVKLGVSISDVSDEITLTRATLYAKRGKVTIS